MLIIEQIEKREVAEQNYMADIKQENAIKAATNLAIGWKLKAQELEEKLAWINLCAEDIISYFPKMSPRMAFEMQKRIDTLAEAIK